MCVEKGHHWCCKFSESTFCGSVCGSLIHLSSLWLCVRTISFFHLLLDVGNFDMKCVVQQCPYHPSLWRQKLAIVGKREIFTFFGCFGCWSLRHSCHENKQLQASCCKVTDISAWLLIIFKSFSLYAKFLSLKLQDWDKHPPTHTQKRMFLFSNRIHCIIFLTHTNKNYS